MIIFFMVYIYIFQFVLYISISFVNDFVRGISNGLRHWLWHIISGLNCQVRFSILSRSVLFVRDPRRPYRMMDRTPYYQFCMNFVLGLPHPQWVTNSIFVVVDKFLKMAMERPWMHRGEPNFNFNKVVCLHGIPRSITLNKNVKLMSNF